MTEVEFHTGVADSAGFACRLLRKAYRQGVRVLVTAPPESVAELDRLLWTFDERDFVPHVRIPGAAAAVAARTPIWLSADPQHAAAQRPPTVVLNLGADAQLALAAVAERLIEVIADDPDAAERGRSRWRAYKAAGFEIKHHRGRDSRD